MSTRVGKITVPFLFLRRFFTFQMIFLYLENDIVEKYIFFKQLLTTPAEYYGHFCKCVSTKMVYNRFCPCFL